MFKYFKRKIQQNYFKKNAPKAFEKFYNSTHKSDAYLSFCKEAHDLEFPVQNNMSPLQKDRLLDHIDELSPKKVLDLGCGSGHFANFLAQTLNANVDGIDFIDGGKFTDGKINFIKSNIEDIELEKEKYDLVISIDSLYMIGNMQKLIKNIMYSLRTEGKFITLYTCVDEFEKSDFYLGLKSLAMKYEAIDFSHNDFMFWNCSNKALQDLNEAFHSEGSGFAWKTKNDEVRKNLQLHEQGRMKRYMIIVTKAAPPKYGCF
jgi:SAM-dependent methyltransferase